jgi:hypothetical protein
MRPRYCTHGRSLSRRLIRTSSSGTTFPTLTCRTFSTVLRRSRPTNSRSWAGSPINVLSQRTPTSQAKHTVSVIARRQQWMGDYSWTYCSLCRGSTSSAPIRLTQYLRSSWASRRRKSTIPSSRICKTARRKADAGSQCTVSRCAPALIVNHCLNRVLIRRMDRMRTYLKD